MQNKTNNTEKKTVDARFLTNNSCIIAIFMLFVISGSSEGFAAHTPIADLLPEWSPANQQVNYTVNLTNGGGDPIYEVRIYKNNQYSDFVCSPKPGWELLFIDVLQACFYVGNVSSPDFTPINAGSSGFFNFTAVTPISPNCNFTWTFETRDNQFVWHTVTDTTSVDTKPPVITKVIGDPKIKIDNDTYYITQNTPITLSAAPGPAEVAQCPPSGVKFCQYRYFVNGILTKDWAEFNASGFTFNYPEDSNHLLEVMCVDHAGNVATLNETDIVDTQSPNTTKTYGTPFFTDGTYDWITSSTPIDLNALDPDPHPVGFDKLFWRNTLLTIPDVDCIEKCNFEGSGNWNIVNTSNTIIFKPEDSCHLIEFYSMDKLNNTEPVKRQCVFVDNQAPSASKIIGNPKMNINGTMAITKNTPINITCNDPQPHPVDHSNLSYRYRISEDCQTWGDWTSWIDPPAIQNEVAKTIYFPEDSCHELEYFCVDSLGNTGNISSEIDIVDTEPPAITKTIGNPQYGTCPANGGGSCYVQDHVTPITFNVTDAGTHKTGISRCEWSYTVNGNLTNSGTEMNFPFTIIFPEDSIHVLNVTCYDNLNNSVSDVETFIVDSIGPLTNKTYGTPFFTDNVSDWITSATPITLNAGDQQPHPVGLNATYWRNTLLGSDLPCYNPKEFCTPLIDNFGLFNLYSGPFFKPEESCHLIEYYSVDLLGNEEPLKWQCVFVDNTPPNVTKVIGNPKIIGKLNISGSCNNNLVGILPAPLRISSTPAIDRNLYSEKYNDEGKLSAASSSICDNASQPNQCAFVNITDLPNYAKDTIKAQLNISIDSLPQGCENVLILSSGNPLNNGTDLSTNMGHIGCGSNPDGFETNDCVMLQNYTTSADISVLAISSEWPEFYKTQFTDWMQISNSISVDMSINNWKNVTVLPQYNPLESGTQTLASNISANSTINLRVADSGDHIYDTTILLVPLACGEPVKPAEKCGDGILQEFLGEECDLGEHNGEDNSGCSATCQIVAPVENKSFCGNLILEQPPAFPNSTEQCDLGALNGLPNSTCSSECINKTLESVCGNGIFELPPAYPNSTEQCDLGNVSNNLPGSGCNADCIIVNITSVCGNGLLEQPPAFPNSTEMCDDGNNLNDDGCSSACQTEIPCNNTVTYISNTTPINITCNDVGAHPVDHSNLSYRYRISNDCQNWGDWSNWTDPADSESLTKTIFFNEDSCHELQYFCADALGNSQKVYSEIDIVDSKPPVINKTLTGPVFVKESVCTENSNGGEPIPPVIINTTGTIVGGVNFTQKCASGTGVGIAYDGQNLWYSCYASPTDLYRANPFTGNVSAMYSIAGGLGALSYDATRNAIWAGWGGGNGSNGDIRLIQLDGSKNVINTTFAFIANSGGMGIDDGLAFDAQDHTLYVSPDISPTIYHYMTNGTLIGTFPRDPGSSCGNSGLALGGSLLYEGFNGCNQVIVVNKANTSTQVFNFSTAQAGDAAFRDEDLECDTNTFASLGKHVMWSVEAYDNGGQERRAYAFEIPFGSCGIGGTPANNCNQTYIDGVTVIHVTATDPEPHPVNNVTCDWSYTVRENASAGGGNISVMQPFDIHFPEESTHDLTIVCKDALNNTVQDNETFLVDKTPPITNKTYGKPFYSNGASEWISSKTNITLSVEDAGPHKSGINATYVRSTIVDDSNCRNETLCENANGEGPWNLYTGAFNEPEQSCHLIEYYSVDNVNKTEKVKKQCVFVDNTPPTPNKTVGNPSDKWDGKDAKFYNISDKCWNGQNNSIDCWKVTTMTPITMSCVDPEPHPSDHTKISFKVDFDNGDATDKYCSELNGTIDVDGYCTLEQETAVELLFRETSEHNLAFYCIDALGNKGPIDDEKFKVDGKSFEITINKKWNLISVPFILLNDSMHKVFDPKADKIMSVWTYDAVTEQWYIYTPDGVDNDNMDKMLPGWGYWVLANNDTKLLIGGNLFSPAKTPPSKTIVKGWNLIGYWGTDNRFGNATILAYNGPVGNGKIAQCELYSLGSTLLDKEFNSLWSYWEPYNPDQWIPYDKYRLMDPGAGYWLHTNQAGDYVAPTDCNM